MGFWLQGVIGTICGGIRFGALGGLGLAWRA